MTTRIHSLIVVQPLISSGAHRLMGYGAALGMVLIWSFYFLSLRQGALSPISRLDMTLFRYAVPGLLLLPLLLRRWSMIRMVSPVWLLGMVLGAGLPFFLLGAIGMGWAPVAQGSTLIPGTAPLFVTLLAVTLFRQPFSRWRRVGLAAVLVGVVCLIAAGMGDTAILGEGQLLFLVCSLLWAVFTVSVRQSGLSPLEAAAVVTVPTVRLWCCTGYWRGRRCRCMACRPVNGGHSSSCRVLPWGWARAFSMAMPFANWGRKPRRPSAHSPRSVPRCWLG
ncbi:hypothetical protein Q427_27370 [Halomonas sp. BC04]|nr:DMT family transporter [Halomonas sp. BC04]EWG99020.1 hypothetical protein Q427_27370 [Halomonas sp. BC04]